MEVTGEAEEAPEPPYLRWYVSDAADPTSTPLATATKFAVQGPRNAAAAPDADESTLWLGSLTSTVEDNVGQEGYTGLDLDKRPGWFTVKQLVDDVTPTSTHDVLAAENYRIRPVEAPAGYLVGDGAEWADLAVLSTNDEAQVRPYALAAPEAAPQALAAEEDLSFDVGIMSVGVPDGGDPPYVYWKVQNSVTGEPVGGATFNFAYRTGGAWSGNATVTDCVVTAPATCASTSLDRDPDPGEFLLTHRALALNTTNRLVDGNNYRMQQATAPSTYTWTAASNTQTIGTANGNTATWNDANGDLTHNFGTFQVTPPLTTKDIVVRKRVFAEPSGVSSSVSTNIGTNYSNTVGTVFRLYTNVSNAPGAPTDFFCEILSGGECTITVTGVNNGGPNYNNRYWVVEEVAGANTYANPDLYLGSYDGPTERRRLVGLTQQVTAAATQMFMPMTASGVTGGTVITTGELPGAGAPSVAEAGSFGAMANSYRNPGLDPKCNVSQLRIALVLDQSASIQAGQWTTFRNALVDGDSSVLGILRSANALVSILGFGTSVSSPNGWHFGASGPAALPANYGTLIPTSRPGGSDNATNWDAALSAIQGVNATHDYDMVLFVTDGAPNVILNGSQVSSFDVTLRSLEAPIYAANAIKAAGSRLVTVGVGNGASGAMVAANLRAVSGEIPNSDYIQGNWNQVKSILTDIVKAATCTVPIEVSKTEIPVTGGPNPYAAGWTFAVAKTGDGSTLTGPTPTQTGAGEDEVMKWNLSFSEPSGQTASLRFSETPQDGWTLTSVACTVAGVNVPVTIAEDGSVTLNGITTSSEKVVCAFTNTETPPTAKLTLVKEVSNTHGGTGVVANWTLTATGPTTVTGKTTEPAITNATVSPGEYLLSEAGGPSGYTASDWTCLNGAASMPVTDHKVTIPAGANVVCTIVNSDLPGSVTWAKVASGTDNKLEGSEWKLTGPGQPPAGTPITDCVAATAAACTGPDKDPAAGQFKLENLSWGSYTLTETKAPPGYVLDATPHNFSVNGGNLAVALGSVDNDQQPGVALPLTGGISAETFGIGGTLIALVALSLAIWYRRRNLLSSEVQ